MSHPAEEKESHSRNLLNIFAERITKDFSKIKFNASFNPSLMQSPDDAIMKAIQRAIILNEGKAH